MTSIITQTRPASQFTALPCPRWCNAHEQSVPAPGLDDEHTHRGVHQYEIADGTVEVDLIQVAALSDVDGVVSLVNDAPYVTITVKRSNELDSTVIQGELPTLEAATAALAAALLGLVTL